MINILTKLKDEQTLTWDECQAVSKHYSVKAKCCVVMPTFRHANPFNAMSEYWKSVWKGIAAIELATASVEVLDNTDGPAKPVDKKMLEYVSQFINAAHASKAHWKRRNSKRFITRGCLKNKGKWSKEIRVMMEGLMEKYNEAVKKNADPSVEIMDFKEWKDTLIN